jgi:hypothetical protein
MKKIILLALVAFISTGCMSTSIKPEAFGKQKRYAVISIIGATDITDLNNGSSPGYSSGSLLGLVRAAASDDVNMSESSDKMFVRTRKILDQEFSKARGFTYIPSKKILNSRSYKKAKGDEPKFGLFSIGLAPGYKYFKEESMGQVKNIMKDNKLDGAIIINAAYNYGTGGVNIGGLVSVGSTRGYSTITISALDKNMNKVWSQNIKKESKESIGNVGGVPKFSELYPLLDESTRSAFQEAVASLDGAVYKQ